MEQGEIIRGDRAVREHRGQVEWRPFQSGHIDANERMGTGRRMCIVMRRQNEGWREGAKAEGQMGARIGQSGRQRRCTKSHARRRRMVGRKRAGCRGMRWCEHRGRTDTDGQDKKGRIEKRRYEISAENPNRTTSDSQSRALATDAQTTHTNTDAGATTAEAAKAIIRVAIVRVRSDGLRRWGHLFCGALALRGGARGG